MANTKRRECDAIGCTSVAVSRRLCRAHVSMEARGVVFQRESFHARNATARESGNALAMTEENNG
jgi:hypothetical protein